MGSSSEFGFCGFYPRSFQNWATTRHFIAIFSLVGTIQGMVGIYIGTNLSTLERRFKIPSQTTGLLFSGSDISQIFSLFLIYYGGSGHRPRWIAFGLGLNALSCLILALPHAIYGPGQDALVLTKEFMNATLLSSSKSTKKFKELPICSKYSRPERCDNDEDDFMADTSIIPKLLLFLSQFMLGIGVTLYYCLGQTYMDDNTKKKNMPKVLGFSNALYMIGPAFGYLLGYICLNIYIDPSLHPIIDNQDPRWLGAWWLGLIILGIILAIFVVFVSMFPHELRKTKNSKKKEIASNESAVPLKVEVAQLENEQNLEVKVMSITEKPTLKEFPQSVKRIFTNKALMFNWLSDLLYCLSSSHFINFNAKYLEVQYQTSPGGGAVVTGPLKILGIAFGYAFSGFVMSKYKPGPRYLAFWHVVIGVFYFFALISYMLLGCESGKVQGIDFDTKMINLTTPCNAACNCDGIEFSPVCHEDSKTTFVSACHAGCTTVIDESTFGQCSCIAHLEPSYSERSFIDSPLRLIDDISKTYQHDESDINRRVIAGPCKQDCFVPWMSFTAVTVFDSIFGSTARMGRFLLNYRYVENRDKSLMQALGGVVFSLLAYIPGSIIFGAIMDSTCLVWNFSCQEKGNCWFYHREDYRYYLNGVGVVLCFFAIFFDMVVCYLSKGIDVYGDKEEEECIELNLNNDDPKPPS